MHTPQRPNGDIFNRMVSGAAYMPDAECAAQTKRIHAATVLAEEHYARGEHAQAMHVYREDVYKRQVLTCTICRVPNKSTKN